MLKLGRLLTTLNAQAHLPNILGRWLQHAWPAEEEGKLEPT